MDALHKALVPTTLSALAPSGSSLQETGYCNVLVASRERMGSALTSLACIPSALNVGEYQNFAKALAAAVGRSEHFKKSKIYKSQELSEAVFKFQFGALKRQYFKLVAEKSPHVVKFAGGTERQVTLHTYIFSMF